MKARGPAYIFPTLSAGKELRILSPHPVFAAMYIVLTLGVQEHMEASRTWGVEVLHPQHPNSSLILRGVSQVAKGCIIRH